MLEINKIFAKYFNSVPVETNKIYKNICKDCGHCCNNMGCHISPFDLKQITVQSIIDLIDESKCISIDWWEGNPFTEHCDGVTKGFFLRIRNNNSSVIDPSFGGRCVILTDYGCPLSFGYRPKGGRDLLPMKFDDCIDGYSKQECACDWFKYHDILEEVYEYYQEKGEITKPTGIGEIFELMKTMSELL